MLKGMQRFSLHFFTPRSYFFYLFFFPYAALAHRAISLPFFNLFLHAFYPYALRTAASKLIFRVNDKENERNLSKGEREQSGRHRDKGVWIEKEKKGRDIARWAAFPLPSFTSFSLSKFLDKLELRIFVTTSIHIHQCFRIDNAFYQCNIFFWINKF